MATLAHTLNLEIAYIRLPQLSTELSPHLGQGMLNDPFYKRWILAMYIRVTSRRVDEWS